MEKVTREPKVKRKQCVTIGKYKIKTKETICLDLPMIECFDNCQENKV